MLISQCSMEKTHDRAAGIGARSETGDPFRRAVAAMPVAKATERLVQKVLQSRPTGAR
jgi:hypothetical protein